MEGQPVYKLAIIGGGPAGVGILVRAARLGYLERLLTLGVVLIHGGVVATLGRGNLGDYVINSNTFAKSLLGSVLDDKSDLDPPESVRGTFLEGLAAHPSALRLAQVGQASVNLHELGKFLEAIGYLARLEILKYPLSSSCLVDTMATKVERLSNGVCQVTTVHNGVEAHIWADKVVLAMGGSQELPPEMELSHRAKAWTSDAVLREPGRRALAMALASAKEKKVCIVGGSHSAFSVAWLLLHKTQAKTKGEVPIAFGSKDITVLHRGPIRCFYNSKKEAEADGVVVDKTDKSGSINTFTGLREDAKALYCAVASGHETRVRLYHVKRTPSGAALQKQACDAAAAIVWCCGYGTNMIPIIADGVAKSFAPGAIKVDLGARVLCDDGASTGLPWLLGIGVGFALRAAVDEMKTETRADGVTVYHRRGATLVLAAVFGPEIYGKDCATFEEMVDKCEKRRKEDKEKESKIPMPSSAPPKRFVQACREVVLALASSPPVVVADGEHSPSVSLSVGLVRPVQSVVRSDPKLAIVPRKTSRVQMESPGKLRARNQEEVKGLRRSSFELRHTSQGPRIDLQAKSCGKPVLAGAAKHAIQGIRTGVL
ncbi:hypothetical protein ACHHYP_14644 [Achlya hypogyna]|uniref:FAD/NAD(P)-binding domain-containing protein n=1 Tax=Achlya hypogyna TaxID=1202772 RepID=A0A1V9YCS6_ACHHY|nr:hypothetical protein ACHHYP_14644 [Achlya hypogyna]